MAWWLEGAISRHFGWVRNPSEAIFCIFLESGKKSKKKKFQEKSVFIGKNRFFSEKNRVLSEKIGFYRKNRRFFADFFSDFSIPISFPAPPKSDFSPKNRPKSAIFLSMVLLWEMVSIYAFGKMSHAQLFGSCAAPRNPLGQSSLCLTIRSNTRRMRHSPQLVFY